MRYTGDLSEDFVSDQETEERLDVHETDIIVSLFHDVGLRSKMAEFSGGRQFGQISKFITLYRSAQIC